MITHASVIAANEIDHETEIKIDITDFGADNSGKYDSTKAIQKALEKAKTYPEEQTVRLVFSPGTYRVTKEHAEVREVHTSNTDSVRFPQKHIGILVEDQKNLILDGQGSQILFEGNMMALAVMQSENIRVENLSWDFQIPSTSELTVFDFDEDHLTIDYFVPAYFNYEIVDGGKGILWQSEKNSEGNFYWTEKNAHRNYGVQIKYPTEMMGRSYHSHINPFAGVSNIEKLENGLLRFSYQNSFPVKTVKGMNYQLLSNAERQTAGAFVFESKDVYFDQVRVSYMHGFGFLVQMAENVYFNRMRFETDIETGKNTSSYADGIHVSGAKGKIEITNSFFNNTHDDPINIHGTFTRAERLIDEHTIQLNYIHAQQGGFQQFHPGDKVIFYTRDTLESSDNEKEYTVKKVQGPDKNNLKSMVVEFEEKLPSYLDEKIGHEPRYVAENITYTPEILIKNNDFKNVFTRMILVTSRKKVVIEDNRFDAPTMPTLFFSNDSDEWYESGPIRDLVIRNNTFKVRTIGLTWWKYAPAIYFHPVTKGGQFPSAENPIHKNILIEGNTFYLESDGALRAESVENLRFINNKIYRLDPEIELALQLEENLSVGSQVQTILKTDANVVEPLKNLPNGPEKNSGSVGNVLEFQNSKDVFVKGNYYDEGLKKNVLIEGMDEEHYRIEDDLKILKERVNLPAADALGKIYYVSSNPEVVSIDAEGIVTAHQKGTADIYAYTLWQESLITSNIVTVEVAASAQKEALSLQEYVYHLDANKDLEIRTSDASPLNLEDYDVKIVEEDILAYENGQFTILDSGIVQVRLENDQNFADIYIIVNNESKQKVMNPMLSVENKDQHFTLEEELLKIKRQGNEDLWGNNNQLSNLVRFDLSEYDRDHFSAEITLEGLPVRKESNSWDSAYFILMAEKNGRLDRDNYVSVGKRAHADGIGMVYEKDAKGMEKNLDLGHDFEKMHFALEKKGDQVTFYYKEGDNYHLIDSFDTLHLGDDFSLALATWGNTQDILEMVARDLKVVNGSIENLESVETIPFMVKDESNPELSDITIKNNGSNHYQVIAKNKHQLNVIVRNDQGRFNVYQGDEFTLNSSGVHDVYVVNVLDSGKYSSFYHEKLEADVSLTQGDFILNQSISDQQLMMIPENLQVLQYQKDDGPIENISIEGKDTLEIGDKTVKLKRLKSSDVSIDAIEVDSKTLDLNKEHSFIYTEDEKPTVKIKVHAKGKENQIKVDNEDHQITYEVDDQGVVEVPVYNGVVSVRIRVFAADGITHKMHTVHLLRNTSYALGQTQVFLDDQEIKDTMIDFENRYSLDDLHIKVSPTAQASIHQHPHIEDQIIIRVAHDDQRTVEFLEFEVANVLEQPFSTQELADLIEKAERLDKGKYTEASYKEMLVALVNAQETLSSPKSQKEIDLAYATLQEAITALEEKIVLDMEALQAFLDQIQKIDLSLYTEASVHSLQEAILEAEEILASASTQEELDRCLHRLQKAFEGLEEVLENQEEPEIPQKPEGPIDGDDVDKPLDLEQPDHIVEVESDDSIANEEHPALPSTGVSMYMSYFSLALLGFGYLFYYGGNKKKH